MAEEEQRYAKETRRKQKRQATEADLTEEDQNARRKKKRQATEDIEADEVVLPIPRRKNEEANVNAEDSHRISKKKDKKAKKEWLAQMAADQDAA